MRDIHRPDAYNAKTVSPRKVKRPTHRHMAGEQLEGLSCRDVLDYDGADVRRWIDRGV